MLPALALALFLSAQSTPLPNGSAGTQANSPARCENPDKNGRYHIGCGVKAPQVIYKVEPEFSEEARKKKITGRSTIGFTLDVNGRPTNIHVLYSASEGLNKKAQKAGLSLDKKAMEAVAQYKFTPATFNGRPVPIDLDVEINFQIF